MGSASVKKHVSSLFLGPSPWVFNWLSAELWFFFFFFSSMWPGDSLFCSFLILGGCCFEDLFHLMIGTMSSFFLGHA